MTYDSPKQIRRRQNAANDKAARPRRTRQIQIVAILTDEQWDSFCDFHLRHLFARANEECADAAGRHARTIVHMAMWRRACQIMVDLGLRSYWKATDMAKHELYNCEI